MDKGVPISQRGELVLSCNCKRWFPKPWPQLFDEIWCVKHNDKVTVVKTPDMIGNYGWKCECGTAHYYGAEKEHSERRALEHHNKHPARTLYLSNGVEVYGEYRASEQMFE